MKILVPSAAYRTFQVLTDCRTPACLGAAGSAVLAAGAFARNTATFAVVCVLACQGACAVAAEPPNIILLMCDDLGYGDLHCFNPESRIRTPGIDDMAANGLKFNRFYAAAPVCSPTRGSCLTGRHPYRYGIYTANRGHMKKPEITLPELLKDHGYETGHFGKWHLGTLSTSIRDSNRGGPNGKKNYSVPAQHGYDDSFVTEAKVPTFDPMLKPRNANGKAWDAITDRSGAVEYGTRYWNHSGEIVTENLDGDDSRIVMDRAVPFIRRAVSRKSRFFATIWFHAPHLPVVGDPKHVAAYSKYSVYERNYYGCMSSLDEQVARLRSELKQLGVAENTMVWFCSDNGPEGKANSAPGSAGGLKGRKRSLYEGGVRVPGILEWPAGISPGSVSDFPAVTSDYLPTILDVLNATYPDQRPIDGVSLLPLLNGNTSRRARPIGFQSASQVAWTEHQYKLYSSDKAGSWELYDLLTDPGESIDIAAEHPEIVRRMTRDVQAWQASCRNSDQERDY